MDSFFILIFIASNVQRPNNIQVPARLPFAPETRVQYVYGYVHTCFKPSKSGT